MVVLGLSACGQRSEPSSTKEAIAGETGRLALNARCEECHAEVAAEWRRSRHRQAFSNDAFTRAYAIEPDPFCAGCHAPEARPLEPATDGARAVGVACVTCHLDDDGVVRAAPGEAGTSAPHRIRRTLELSGDRACARCHEFAFPGRTRDEPEWMQTTLAEHARSRFSELSCASCHMPSSTEHERSHEFASVRSPARLRAALRVSAERSPSGVRLLLSTYRVGHAFPTGDLFRRLRLTAEALDGHGVVRREQRYLARHFRFRRKSDGSWLRVLSGDDRPGGAFDDDGAVTVELALGEWADGRAIRWSVAYERVDHLAGDSEDAATVADSVELAGGTLSP